MSNDTTEVKPASSTSGIALMVFAMLAIPIVDGLAKYLSSEHSPLFLSWARYAVACLIVLPIADCTDGIFSLESI